MRPEFCDKCGEPLEVVEMLAANLDQVDEDAYCDFCLTTMLSDWDRVEDSDD